MVTIVKLNALGAVKIQYQGEVIERLANGVIIEAYWSLPAKDLGYTAFEPGDTFHEYYYTDRWYNIFEITGANAVRKGWYCNVAEPAIISADRIEQVDLLLDVWVTPTGETLVLDEDEFAADKTLGLQQRAGAQKGLQELLAVIAARQETFASIA
jgi:predicted RNA-binding protein associated with RNAse of E/G family